MNDFLARVAALPEDKRHLLNVLLRREPAERPDLSDPYVAPRTDVEQRLAEIWSQVLGVAQVGVHDHFMELGGDSILAIQVMAMARERGMTLSSAQLFATPTIAAIAESLAAAPAAPEGDVR